MSLYKYKVLYLRRFWLGLKYALNQGGRGREKKSSNRQYHNAIAYKRDEISIDIFR